jgi:hypothetical protein
MREAAERFLECEGRAPTVKELQVLADVASFGYAKIVLSEWRRERGVPRHMPWDVTAGDVVRAAADRFLERMRRCPSGRELAGELAREGSGLPETTIAIHLSHWHKERNVPVRPPRGRAWHDLALVADRLLASLGRAPTGRELQEATGMGHALSIERFLKAWCEERGVPRPESSPIRHVPFRKDVRRRWNVYLEAADRFLERMGRGPTARELQAEAGEGSKFQAEDFLKDWRIRRGVPLVHSPMRHDMERAAERLLDRHGRVPTVEELLEATGRGSRSTVIVFLREWPGPGGVRRPPEDLPQDSGKAAEAPARPADPPTDKKDAP